MNKKTLTCKRTGTVFVRDEHPIIKYGMEIYYYRPKPKTKQLTLF